MLFPANPRQPLNPSKNAESRFVFSHCSEPNKPDSKFCVKCRMVLTYDAYSETLEKQQEKDSEVQILKQKYEQDINAMREEIENKFQQILVKIEPS